MKAEIYWLRDSPVRLAVLPRPRGGDYLADEIASLAAQGVNVLVSLLTPAETIELDLADEAAACADRRVRFVGFPIEDRAIPDRMTEARALVRDLQNELGRGRAVGIHCRAGIGRSAMIAAAILAASGIPVPAAFEMIAASRGCEVPDTPRQRAWVEEFLLDA